MYLAGFDVKDVHMTDLISGRETRGHSVHRYRGWFSLLLGSAKGYRSVLYNEKRILH
jgi:hypothetical protein